MKKKSNGFIGYVVLIVSFIFIAVLLNGSLVGEENKRIEYPRLMELISEGQVSKVAIRNDALVGLLEGSAISDTNFPDRSYDFETTIGEDFVLEARQVVAEQKKVPIEDITIKDLGFDVEYRAPIVTPWYMEFLPFLIIIILTMVFWLFIMQRQGGNGKVMNFGKSKAKMSDPTKNKISFKDVAGAVEEKEELQEMVDFLKNPKAYTKVGARIPKGVLLIGPPGTGKTLLAKAVAGEAGAPFFSISGSDFVEMFVGVGASRVRDLFEQAKKASPSIIFIDEIDAVGRHRGAGMGGGHDEREQTLNQLLVEMDGFSENEGVIVMAATNRRDILDPALMRPGRFDRQVNVNYPDNNGRVEILKVHSKGKPVSDEVDYNNIAKRMPFSTGADLENVMNEAAILAARNRKEIITMDLLIEAISRVQMGPEKKSHKVTPRDRKTVAYHEAGHAVIGHLIPECDDVHLVTIVPRGQAGGYTLSLPSEENDNISRKQLISMVTMALGGHAAEEIALGDFFTGSSSDLKRATEICRKMVTQFGMSENIGTIYLGKDEEVFVGMEFGHSREYSEEIAAKVDREIEAILARCYASAKEILIENRDRFEAVVKALLEQETLSREDFVRIIENNEDLTQELPSEVKVLEEKSSQDEQKTDDEKVTEKDAQEDENKVAMEFNTAE